MLLMLLNIFPHFLLQIVFSYFPPLKPRWVLWSEKYSSYLQGSSHKTVSWFLKRTLQARRNWQEIFTVMKSRDLQPRLLYPAKLSFRIEGQIKSFQDEKKTKGVHHHKTIIIWNVKGIYLRKRRSKPWIIKWQQICIYQQLNLKNKANKENTDNHGNRVFWCLPDGRGCGGMGEEVRGLRSTNR